MRKAQMYRLREIVLKLQQLADKHEPELKSLLIQEMLKMLNEKLDKMEPLSPMQAYKG